MPVQEGNERAVAERRKRWRVLFPRLDSARDELAAAKSGQEAAKADLREAETAVEEHEYSRLLAVREAARKRVEEAEARRRQASDTINEVSGGVPFSPYGPAGRQEFDRQHAEWRREREAAGEAA